MTRQVRRALMQCPAALGRPEPGQLLPCKARANAHYGVMTCYCTASKQPKEAGAQERPGPAPRVDGNERLGIMRGFGEKRAQLRFHEMVQEKVCNHGIAIS